MHSNTGVCRACSSLHRTACRQVQPFLGALVQKAHVSDETYGARSDCTHRMLATLGGPARPMAILWPVRADAALSTARRWSRSLIVVSVQHAPAVLAQSCPLKWRPSGSVSRRYQLKSARCDWRWVCAAVRRHAWAGHLLAAPSRTTVSSLRVGGAYWLGHPKLGVCWLGPPKVGVCWLGPPSPRSTRAGRCGPSRALPRDLLGAGSQRRPLCKVPLEERPVT